MNTSAPLHTPETDDQFLPLSRAAQILSVHISTLRRWIRQGKLPAYRVGDKGVRVRRGDVLNLLNPLSEQEQGRRVSQNDQQPVRRLTAEEQRKALEAIARVQRLRDEIYEKHGLMTPGSWELLNDSRDDRTKNLMADETETVHVPDDSDLARLLERSGTEPVRLECNGVVYYVTREDDHRDYDAERFEAVLAATVGSWADIDTDDLIAKIYRWREEGSRPASRP